MGIKIINSFELNSPLPLDARAVANNINEMNELITKNFVVAGQMCYNKADNKLYVLKKNSEGALLSWHEIADSVDLDNINKVLPTDIAVKDNKLGLEHDNVWLTNQNAINLGSNLEYDATTKTLNAKGGGGESLYTLTLSESQIAKINEGNPFPLTDEQYANLLNRKEFYLFAQVDENTQIGYLMSIVVPTSSTDSFSIFTAVDQDKSLIVFYYEEQEGQKTGMLSFQSLEGQKISQYISDLSFSSIDKQASTPVPDRIIYHRISDDGTNYEGKFGFATINGISIILGTANFIQDIQFQDIMGRPIRKSILAADIASGLSLTDAEVKEFLDKVNNNIPIKILLFYRDKIDNPTFFYDLYLHDFTNNNKGIYTTLCSTINNGNDLYFLISIDINQKKLFLKEVPLETIEVKPLELTATIKSTVLPDDISQIELNDITLTDEQVEDIKTRLINKNLEIIVNSKMSGDGITLKFEWHFSYINSYGLLNATLPLSLSCDSNKIKANIDLSNKKISFITESEIPDFKKLSLAINSDGALTLNTNYVSGTSSFEQQGDYFHFSKINGKSVVDSAPPNVYAPTTINNTATQMFLTCINGDMQWTEVQTAITEYLKGVAETTIDGERILQFTYWDGYKENYRLDNFKQINLFGNHSILVPKSSTDTNIDLYNHFIKITGTKDTIQVRARFTIQSSKNLVVDSLTDLYTLLGNEFEIGCSGLFGENNLTGLRKTTEGVLELIYNNGGAESLQNVAGLTISITDKVKTV